ncbi:hypothetical protein GPECTOR_41g617 [Gonium pectorale]|uniref:Ubiquitin carboxyl-terminal hydrolase n=1 Tax=Gonium pectorale TaxID=33097 RepID=A0A150GA55_GONPE|nr:hypothetical protein GPECTOR_41g617 [Gonium pectorale]|eukprot:KXZ46653.1 hypothetical protein GPECTOR_41g617 [Gonium pectorale]
MPQAEHSVLSLPARWKGNQRAGAGLSNLGNSCYLNSTLQCLAYIPPLGHLCLIAGHSSTCGRSSAAAGSGPPCTFCLVERTLGSLLRGQRGGPVSPGELTRQLHLFGRTFVRGRQEDSHEFLTALLDVIERDGRRAAVARGAPKGCRTIVEDLFVGCWQSQVRCLKCGYESNTYESFATLPLDIGQARTVTEGLRAFTEAERLDGSNKYKCDKCRQLVPAIKQTTIWDDPNVLVLHLKRFDGGSFLGKVSRHVAFPEQLELGAFMTPPASRRRAEQQHAEALAAARAKEEAARAGEAAAGPAANGHHHHHHDHGHGHGHDSGHHHHHHEHEHHHLDGHHHHQNHGDHHHDDHPHRTHEPYGPQLPPHANGTGNGRAHHHGHSQSDPPSTSYTDSGGGGAAGGAAGGPASYVLTGVLVHQGSSLNSGHYYALVRDSENRWSVMNDSQVYGTSLDKVREEQAYLLFYTRQAMKLPRPAPVVPPAPAAAAAAKEEKREEELAEVGPQPAPQQRRAIGPQLPPGIVKLRAAAAAGAGARSANGLLGPRLGLGKPGQSAPPSARLAARPSGSAAPDAQIIGPAPRPVIGPAPRPEAVPEPAATAAATTGGSAATSTSPSAAAGAAAAGIVSPEPGARKRKLDEALAGDEAAATSAADPRVAAEEELRAAKAGSSWRDGMKRLKTSLIDLLRESDWVGAVRAKLEEIKASGLGLSEVLAGAGGDELRRLKHRGVPLAVLEHGRGELSKMLRSILLVFGSLGSVPLV